MTKELREKLMTVLLLVAVMVVACVLLDGGLRLLLLIPLYIALMEIMTPLVRMLLKEPELGKLSREELLREEEAWYTSRQDPKTMKKLRPVGWIINGLSTVVTVLNICMVGDYAVWPGVGVLLFAAAILLCSVFPAYFSLNHHEKEKNRVTTFPIINMLIPYCCTLATNAVRSLTDFTFVDGMAVVEAVVMVFMVAGFVMRLVVPEFRRHTTNWLGGMFLLLIFSLGLAVPINHIFELQEPQIVKAMVIEWNPGGHRTSPTFTMHLPDGTLIEMVAKNGFADRDYYLGQTIPLEYHEGALGISYYCYQD